MAGMVLLPAIGMENVLIDRFLLRDACFAQKSRSPSPTEKQVTPTKESVFPYRELM